MFSIHLPSYLCASLAVVLHTESHSTPLLKHRTYVIKAACHFFTSDFRVWGGASYGLSHCLPRVPVSLCYSYSMLAALLHTWWKALLSRLAAGLVAFRVRVPHSTATAQRYPGFTGWTFLKLRHSLLLSPFLPGISKHFSGYIWVLSVSRSVHFLRWALS